MGRMPKRRKDILAQSSVLHDGAVETALVLANGRPPAKRLLRRLSREVQLMVCADGGANAAARAGVRPDLIIGDLDSVTPGTLRTFRSVPIRRLADQNSTDLEKAIRWLLRKGIRTINIVGATGGRLDHVAGNLHVLGKFGHRANLQIVEEHGKLVAVGRSRVFPSPGGSTLSLIPLSRCSGITTRGLRWELRNETLELGRRDGTSNVVVTSPVTIRVRSGTLLVYCVTPTRPRRR